jgi:phenylalanyl-tRNA synthetase beta chain
VRITYGWLKEFVPDAPGVGETAGRLSAGGLGIASVVPFSSSISGVVVGSVRSVAKHPNADRLSVCSVQAGGELYEVVCGAPNVRENTKYPFALPGARLPNGMTITPRAVRGVTSRGMLCSSAELGINADASGLLELPPDAVVGEPYVPFPEDWVLDIEVTPNRGDALSVLGVARQLSAVLGVKWKYPWPEPIVPDGPGNGWNVAIEDSKGCGLYTARLLRGVKVGPSPEWMQKRLAACGMRPINNVVDITNYVLLETGHPLHAFDTAKLAGRGVIIRRARAGEVLKTLDGTDRKLNTEVLVIADETGPVAAAGIMGGAVSEISPATESVLLESAWFDPVRIRRGARVLGLGTEASYRFERGVDPGGVVLASQRAAMLMVDLAGAVPDSPLVSTRGDLPEPGSVEVGVAGVSDLLGTAFTMEQLEDYSRRLGAEVVRTGEDALRVTPPSWRPDLRLPADLAEEFATIFGYERIPSTMPELAASPLPLTRRSTVEEIVRDALRAAGFSEALTLGFMSRSDVERLGIRVTPVGLANPMNEEQEYMRTTIVPGLLRSAAYNMAREAPGVALFEIGHVFEAGSGRTIEKTALALIAAGGTSADAHVPARAYDFYDIKGALDSAAGALGISLEWGAGTAPALEPGKAAAVMITGRAAGLAGALRASVTAVYELPTGAVVAELDFDYLVDAARIETMVVSPPRFPSMRRDLAVVVGEQVQAVDLEKAITAAGAPLLDSTAVFDVYRGKQVPAGTKSLAFRMVFRSPGRTLTESEVNETFARVVAELEKAFQARLRS